MLGKIKWADVMTTLQSDLQRGYKIDIETNSTIEATSQEDKQNLNEALTAMGNGYQSFLPAVQAGAMTMPALKSILGATVRRFEFGKVVEDAISGMPDQLPPPPPDPKQAQQAQEAQKQVMQAQQQLQKEKMALEQQKAQLDLEQQKLQMKVELLTEKLRMKEEQLKDRISMMQEKHSMDVKNSLESHSRQIDASIQQAAMERDQAVQEAALQQKASAQDQQARDKMAQVRHREMLGAMKQATKTKPVNGGG